MIKPDKEQYLRERNEKYIAELNEVLRSGAGVNSVDSSDETPLMKAIRLTDTALRLQYMEALIAHGADPGLRDGDGEGDALFEAVLYQDAIALECLLSHGANPNYILDTPESLYDCWFLHCDSPICIAASRVDMLS
jgi:ankyrin repeat protein